MPVFIHALWGFLLSILPTVVGRVLLALGFTYVAYTGFSLSIEWLLDQIKASFAGLPAEIAAFFAWLWIDRAVSMIFSAYTVAMAYKTGGQAVIKRLLIKG